MGCRVGGSLRILRILRTGTEEEKRSHLRASGKLRKSCRRAADLRAMLRTLVLLRTRCGALDTEVEEVVGGEDKVWTFKTATNRVKVISDVEWPMSRCFRCWNLSHDLPPVEEHFVSFSEAIVRPSWLLLTCSSQPTHTSSVQHVREQRGSSILELNSHV